MIFKIEMMTYDLQGSRQVNDDIIKLANESQENKYLGLQLVLYMSN